MDIKHICDLLEKAKDQYSEVTPNQLGMPAHLLSVASILGEAIEEITKLEKRCIKESNHWMKNIYGYGNNNNSNNNNSKKNNNNTRKRKRTESPKRNNK